MIVPSAKLLFWVAAVLLPLTLALPTSAAPAAVAGIAIFITIALADLVVSLGRLDQVQVALPDVLRFSRDRKGEVPVQLRNPGGKPLRLRLGLVLPGEIRPDLEDLVFLVPSGTELSQIPWACTPLKRGVYRLTAACLETASFLQLWAVRRVAAIRSEIRVYPNLLSERKTLASLFLNRGASGIHAQRQIGKGRDFEKLREYLPGDSYDEVHWKATAKRGHPVTKVFQIERTQEVYVILDASRLSGRAAPVSPDTPADAPGEIEQMANGARLTVLERFITAALVLGLAAEKQGDLFGLVTFSDKIDRFVRARNGKSHFNTCRDALYTLQPQIVTPDFEEVASFIRLRMRRRALLIVLTALDDPVLAESFVRSIGLVSGQHLVLVNMIKPPGTAPLFTRPEADTLDDLYRHLGGHLRWRGLRELEKTLQRRGVRFSLLEQEQLAVQLVSQYLGVKQRQLI